MNKKIKGYELIKMLQENQVKEGTIIKDNYNTYIFEKNGLTDDLILFIKDTDTCRTVPDYSFFADNDNEFEILEDEEIDKGDMVMFEHEWFVQHMPEMNDVECDLAVKMNAIIYYLLKLDKKINKED